MQSLSVQYVKGVGEKRALMLHKLGIYDLESLVHFYPRSYLDFTNLVPIIEIKPDTVCCFSAVVGYTPKEHRIRKGMTVYKTLVTDGAGGVHITIFNNKYLAARLEAGSEYIFYGKVTAKDGRLEMANPIAEVPAEDAAMLPVYPLTAGITSKSLSKIINNGLYLYFKDETPDTIPDYIRRRYNLCHKSFALKAIHFPKNQTELDLARKRLIFEELLILQAGMKKLKGKTKAETAYQITNDVSAEFIAGLPFTPTGAQERAIKDCLSDMRKKEPMNRLIQGDVGSGKTAVAVCSAFVAAKNGFQTAFMAPTEILAQQHFASLKNLIKDEDIKTELLTGSLTPKQKREVKEKLKNGEIHILVGTHALVTDDVEFKSLGLVITDEQHRFGVRQRGALSAKGSHPHTLVMSATPIPRTLSLIIYGDLDLSIIDELPKGRQKISTYAVDSSYHERLYVFIKKHLDKGLQAYIVCPAVEESESDITSAVEYEKDLREIFSSYKVGLLHGKMKPRDKEKVMSDFSKGEIQLLVATTVIEVGVDVPNAVIMLIENAERFGLSQLHQLRGRVGRGKEKSYCVLVSDSESESASARLEIMCKTSDGFVLADKDLELRGPGDFFGSRQHGLPELKIADLTENMDIVRMTKEACETIFDRDPDLSSYEHRGIKEGVEKLFGKDKKISFN